MCRNIIYTLFYNLYYNVIVNKSQTGVKFKTQFKIN